MRHDITTENLEAAILDQQAAGMFHDKVYCFTRVYHEGAWRIGVAVANEDGYHPVPKKFTTEAEARDWAERLNKHIGVEDDHAVDIIASTMGGRRVAVLP